MHRVFVTAPAKVNLCLHVGAKRADGYHDIESLAAFATLDDAIWLEPAEAFSVSVVGPFAAGLTACENNLAIAAAKALAELERSRRGVRVTLEKRIPVAAGLGGGSADAAAVLRGLIHLWNLDLGREELRKIATSIGADVPACVDSATAWMEGRGERITILPALPDIRLLLVNPRVAVPTGQVFAQLRKRRGVGLDCPQRPFDDAHGLVEFLKSTTNDLELPAGLLAPVIGEVLEELTRLPGVLLARMSGSGATCFGLFENDCAIRPALELLGKRRPAWWFAATSLSRGPAGTPIFVQ